MGVQGKKQSSRNYYQAQIFIITFLSYAILHFNREAWSVLKPKIQALDNFSSS